MRALSYKPLLQGIYIAAAMLFTAFTLSRYAVLLQQYISIRYSFYFELGMVAGQLLFQSLFLLQKKGRVIYHYWLQLLGVSLAGSLLLWLFPGMWSFPAGSVIALVYFLCVVAVMFFLHRARLRKPALPAYLSYTWLLYRSLILLYIL